MKKIFCIIAISMLFMMVYAGIHQDNIRYIRKIEDATQAWSELVDAYFDGVQVNGIIVELTAAQKESLKVEANRWMDTIRIYTDSLENY